MKICFLSIDVEKKEETGSFEGAERLDNLLNVFRKHKANATLFVTGEILEKYPDLVKKWSEKFEIGCHNYYHIPLDKLGLVEREKQIIDFIDLYKDVINILPKGFRAPRNIFDNEQFPILEKYNFLYDASVFPRYPLRIKKYEGYRGRAPIMPYSPERKNYKQAGEMDILEIPESPAFLNIPLVGTWLRKLGSGFFKSLFLLRKPEFVSFSMHSWDGVSFEGRSSKNSGETYLKQLDEMLGFLRKIGYEFKSGEQIASDATNL